MFIGVDDGIRTFMSAAASRKCTGLETDSRYLSAPIISLMHQAATVAHLQEGDVWRRRGSVKDAPTLVSGPLDRGPPLAPPAVDLYRY